MAGLAYILFPEFLAFSFTQPHILHFLTTLLLLQLQSMQYRQLYIQVYQSFTSLFMRVGQTPFFCLKKTGFLSGRQFDQRGIALQSIQLCIGCSATRIDFTGNAGVNPRFGQLFEQLNSGGLTKFQESNKVILGKRHHTRKLFVSRAYQNHQLRQQFFPRSL